MATGHLKYSQSNDELNFNFNVLSGYHIGQHSSNLTTNTSRDKSKKLERKTVEARKEKQRNKRANQINTKQRDSRIITTIFVIIPNVSGLNSLTKRHVVSPNKTVISC